MASLPTRTLASPGPAKLFESLQVLTQPNMPASIPSRQAVVNQAQALVTRMQTMDARIEEIREGVNTGIRLTVDNINAQANKIAELNKQIQQLSRVIRLSCLTICWMRAIKRCWS